MHHRKVRRLRYQNPVSGVANSSHSWYCGWWCEHFWVNFRVGREISVSSRRQGAECMLVMSKSAALPLLGGWGYRTGLSVTRSLTESRTKQPAQYIWASFTKLSRQIVTPASLSWSEFAKGMGELCRRPSHVSMKICQCSPRPRYS